MKSPKVTLEIRMPRLAISSAVDSVATTVTSLPDPLEHPGQQPTDASRPEDRDPHRGAFIRTPGFITPAGSTAALAPRRAAANGSGRWRS